MPDPVADMNSDSPSGEPAAGQTPPAVHIDPRHVILPSQPPREPLAALLLNIFFASVGYFIIGQWQKGLAATIAFLVELVLAFVVGLVMAGCGVLVVIPLSLAFHAVLSVDVYLQAKVLQSGRAIAQWTFFNQAVRS
jgi:hypothetical protein